MLCWLRARAGRWFRGPNGEKLLAREVLVDHGPGEAHTGKEEGRERWANWAAGGKKERAAGWAKGIGLLRFLSFSKSNSISYFYFQLKQIYLNSNKNLNSTTLCTQAK